MSKHIKTWDERVPKPRVEYQCSMNCSPCRPGRTCGDCAPVKVYGDPIAARDAEIAELRTELAIGATREGGITKEAFEEIAASWDGCEGEGCDDIGMALRHDFDRLAAPAAGTEKDAVGTRMAAWLYGLSKSALPYSSWAKKCADLSSEWDAAIAAHTKAKEGA